MVRNVHLARALADLKSRLGVSPADLSADELADLVHAADRCESPFRGVNADLVGRPVRVCEGIYFWRLTIGASVWLDEMSRLFDGDKAKYRMCLVYALVHAREPDAFAGLEDAPAVTKAVTQTCREITATPEELNAALDEILGLASRRPVHAEGVRRAATDWSALIARLESQTGIPADDWVWGRSSAYALRAYNDLHAFAAAYAGGNAETMRDELDAANEYLMRTKVAIMRAHTTEAPHV